MSHTPTPWMTIEKWSPDVCMIGTATGTTNYIATLGPRNDGDMHANAAHIVHCVNTYPQLVEALQRCIAALAANGAPNCEAAKEAKAALAAAEKGA